jgi:hypothetical protein
MHVDEVALVQALLEAALDEPDAEPRSVTALVDRISCGHERARLGADQARRRDTVALDER